MTTRPRSRIDRAAQAGCASLARPTARATSSGVVKGARPISPPVAGSRTIISGRSDLAGMLWAIANDYRAEARAMKEESFALLHENLCAPTLEKSLVAFALRLQDDH